MIYTGPQKETKEGWATLVRLRKKLPTGELWDVKFDDHDGILFIKLITLKPKNYVS